MTKQNRKTFPIISKDEGRRCVVNWISERHYVLTVASLMFQIFWNGHVSFHI